MATPADGTLGLTEDQRAKVEKFIRFASKRGQNLVLSEDQTKVCLIDPSTGKTLCTSPVTDFF